jgi:hypothetical protein
MLEWDEPIRVRRLFQDPKTSDVREETITIEPGGLPLEVGSSSHYCTWHHMWDSWGVARWPYDCPYITLLIRDRDYWGPSTSGDDVVMPLVQGVFNFD